MSDLISRKDVIEKIAHTIIYGKGLGYNLAREILCDIPSAQPEQKVGKWIITKTERSWNCGEYPIEVTCSNCGYIEDYYKKNNFCPCCGADMRGEE